MTSSTLTRNDFSTIKHPISPHETHSPFKRTCDERRESSVSPSQPPSPAIKEEYQRPLPSIESRVYNPERIQFGLDPDRTPRRFEFQVPFPPLRSSPPLADNKAQGYGISRLGGCTSECANVEFRFKSDDEFMFRGPNTALTSVLNALPEIAKLFRQCD